MKTRIAKLLHALSITLLVPAILLAQASTGVRSATLDAKRLERLTVQFDSYVKNKQLAGGVIMIAHKGKIAYRHTFGMRDIESSSRMPENAIFRIASQTKALISVGIMILQEEGRLLISDPASKYIPEFANTTVAVAKDGGGYDIVKAKRQITIRDLLTHTSGFGYGTGVAKDKWEAAKITGWYFADRDEPIRATVARMAALPADAQPGEKYVYGYSTDILGAIIEIASGQDLDVFLQDRIFGPLRMTDTHFYLPASKVSRLATVYSARPNAGGIGRTPDDGTMVSQGHYVNGPRKSFSGGAGLLSTDNDYMRFLLMMRNGGQLDGPRILSRKSVELMTVDHLGSIPYTAGSGFGLGFSVKKDLGLRGELGTVGEYGWGGAYHSTYWVDPKEDLVVVYFTQLIPAGGLDDHAKLRALIYQSIVD
jgi:CubicO group peptidase (beta-lactamase class C family)